MPLLYSRKSAFLPKDAREFIDIFKVELPQPQAITISRTDDDREAVTIPVKSLEKFAKDGEADPEVRKALSAVGKGSRLWGRKLGLMALATVKRRRLSRLAVEVRTDGSTI